MSSAVADVREKLLFGPESPWVGLGAGVIDSTEHEIEDEEHTYVQDLSHGWGIAEDPVYGANVMISNRGGIDQVWLEHFEHCGHKRESGKKGEEDGSSEPDCDEDEAISLSVEADGAPIGTILTNT